MKITMNFELWSSRQISIPGGFCEFFDDFSSPSIKFLGTAAVCWDEQQLCCLVVLPLARAIERLCVLCSRGYLLPVMRWCFVLLSITMLVSPSERNSSNTFGFPSIIFSPLKGFRPTKRISLFHKLNKRSLISSFHLFHLTRNQSRSVKF